MQFPSDSWGLFGRNVMKEYADKATEERNSPVGIMKTVMEGLRMPVHNPKTGEQDHVDLKLVNNIVVESQYMEDMVSNRKLKVSMTLEGLEKSNEVKLIAKQHETNMNKHAIMPLQKFEEILYKTLNEQKDQRLENVDEFKEMTNNLIDEFIVESRSKALYLAHHAQDYNLKEGVGIIRDIKTNQDVGTFESVEYIYDAKKGRIANIEGIILSGRTFNDLEEFDRFEFSYYSLSHQATYSFLVSGDARISSDESDEAVDLRNFSLLAGEFKEDHQYFTVTQQAQEGKAAIQGLDHNHPLYDSEMQKFRLNRLSILEESKNKQKQEKLVNQFADIDLGFDF